MSAFIYVLYIYIYTSCVCPLNMGKETDTQQAEQPYLSKLSKLSSRANVCSHCKIQNMKKCKHLPSSLSSTAPPLHVHYFLRHGGQGAWLWRALLFALAAAGESFINKKNCLTLLLGKLQGLPCLPPHFPSQCNPLRQPLNDVVMAFVDGEFSICHMSESSI